MDLFKKIKAIYPEIKSNSFTGPNPEIVIRDDMNGRGPYIEKWDHPVFPEPSKKDLAAQSSKIVFASNLEPTPEEKLNAIGLTVAELKSLLGIS